MRKPNFLISGASRSGTTSLYYYLSEHSDIFMSKKKELRYFDRNDRYGDEESYIQNFKDSSGEKIIGESSPPYFYNYVRKDQGGYTQEDESPARRIAKFNQDMKVLISLRNPVDRAYSQYWKNRNNHSIDEGTSFLEVCREESRGSRTIEGEEVCYLYKNNYPVHLRPWFENFPDNQIKIIIFEEWIQNPESVLEEICEFLNVDSTYDFSDVVNEQKNSSRIYRSRMVKYVYRKNPMLKYIYRNYFLDTKLEDIVKNVTHRDGYPDMSEETREFVYKQLEDDIEETEELLGRDLDVWKP